MPATVTDWETLCAICASANYRGDLLFRQVDEAPGTASDSRDLERTRLCVSCFGLLRSTLAAGVSREGNIDHLPSLPPRHRATTAGPGCHVCWEPPGQPWFIAELWSGSHPPTGPSQQAGERLQRTRMCVTCISWFRDVIDEESVARWTHRRRADVDQLHAQPQRPWVCEGTGLRPQDEEILKQTVSDLGHVYRDAGSDPATAPDVVFVGAGAFAATTTLADGPLMVVISPPNETTAAVGLMLAGASDLLVSPLSRPQVIGALDRLSDPDAFAGRDPETGLPSYRPEPRFGLPCHLVGIEPPEDVAGLDVYVTLRRFLRGYDRVGLDSGTLVPVVIYCPEANVERVIGRMKAVLGEGYDFSLLATMTEGLPDPALLLPPGLSPEALRRAS